MKSAILFFCILSVGFYSCKKCITCNKNVAATSTRAVCTSGSTNITTCDSNLTGSGLTLDQYIQQAQQAGFTCVKTGGTAAEVATEKLCWETDNAHNTAVTARKGFNIGDRVFVAWFPEDCILMGRDAALPLVETTASSFTTETAETKNVEPPVTK